MQTIPQYDFHRTKYGEELLIDLVELATIKKYVARYPVHTLSYFDITFITEGSGFFIVDDQSYLVHPGDVVFSKPHEIRSWDKEHIRKGYAILFEEEFLLTFFNDPFFLQHLRYYQPQRTTASISLPPDRLRITQLIGEIQAEITHYQSKDKHILRALLYEMLMLLNRAYDQATVSTSVLPNSPNRHLNAFFELVNTHFPSHHTTTYYADKLCITPNYLNEIVQKNTGTTAKSHILNRLMLEAKKLLTYTDLSITEIASRLNFESTSYFIRLFRSQTHYTPLQYRHLPKR